MPERNAAGIVATFRCRFPARAPQRTGCIPSGACVPGCQTLPLACLSCACSCCCVSAHVPPCPFPMLCPLFRDCLPASSLCAPGLTVPSPSRLGATARPSNEVSCARPRSAQDFPTVAHLLLPGTPTLSPGGLQVPDLCAMAHGGSTCRGLWRIPEEC